jgi:hypothetical protein
MDKLTAFKVGQTNKKFKIPPTQIKLNLKIPSLTTGRAKWKSIMENSNQIKG